MIALLDTNAYTAFTRGSANVLEVVLAADEVAMSAVVVGELLYGFRWGRQFDNNMATLQEFMDSPKVRFLDVTRATADLYAVIMAALRSKGRLIPTNDIWIAAQSMEANAALVSADAHFESVDDLAWVRLDAR